MGQCLDQVYFAGKWSKRQGLKQFAYIICLSLRIIKN